MQSLSEALADNLLRKIKPERILTIPINKYIN